MTHNTRLTLIDMINAALASRKPEDLKAARHLLQVKCYQTGTDMIAFLFDDVFKPAEGIKTEITDKCPFCTKVEIKGIHGLKTHISRVHPEKFEEWKVKNSP